MSFDPRWGRRRGEQDRPVLATRKRGPLLPTIIALVVLGVLSIIAARLWVDVLWYQATGYTNVFTTVLGVRALLFVVVGALTGAAVYASLSLGYRMRPVYAPVSPEQASLDRYREQIDHCGGSAPSSCRRPSA